MAPQKSKGSGLFVWLPTVVWPVEKPSSKSPDPFDLSMTPLICLGEGFDVRGRDAGEHVVGLIGAGCFDAVAVETRGLATAVVVGERGDGRRGGVRLGEAD